MPRVAVDKPTPTMVVGICHEPGCLFVRHVTTDRIKQNVIYKHRIYGPVTVLEAAQLDVKFHECDTYRNSIKRMRKVVLSAREQFARVARDSGYVEDSEGERS